MRSGRLVRNGARLRSSRARSGSIFLRPIAIELRAVRRRRACGEREEEHRSESEAKHRKGQVFTANVTRLAAEYGGRKVMAAHSAAPCRDNSIVASEVLVDHHVA